MEKKKYMKIPIFRHIILGDFYGVKQLASDDKKLINFKSKTSGDTCLIMAARYKQTEIIKYLINSGSEIEEFNFDGKRALHESVSSGCFTSTKLLLEANAEVDPLKRADWTPAMFACVKGYVKILELLVSFGANINLLNKDGWSCFMLACREGHVELLKYLITLNPDIYKVKSNNDRTPLHTSSMHGQFSPVIFLIEHCKVCIDSEDSCGTTPLMDALCFGHVEIAQYLITNNANMHAADKYGNMVIHRASQSGCLQSVDFLIKHHFIDVNQPSNMKTLLPIHYAAKEGHKQLLDYLIQNGAHVNAKDCNGRTPLHLATAANKIEVVKYLCAIPQVNVNCCDVFGKKAEDYVMTPTMRTLFDGKQM